MAAKGFEGQIRQSLIWVTSDSGLQTFTDIRDVPPELRRRIEASTQSPEAAYMVIADRPGRERIDPHLEPYPEFTKLEAPAPPTAWVVAWVWGALFLAWAVSMILR